MSQGKNCGQKPLSALDTSGVALTVTVEMYSWYAPDVGMIKRVDKHRIKDEKSENFGDITN